MVSWFAPGAAQASTGSLLPPPVTPGAFSYLSPAEIAFLDAAVSRLIPADDLGATVVATRDKPTGLAMPAFGWKLTDAEIADLTTYIRNAWGNHASAVSASDVAKVRKELQKTAAR